MKDLEYDRRISALEKEVSIIKGDLRFLIRHMIKTKVVPTTEIQTLEKRYSTEGEE